MRHPFKEAKTKKNIGLFFSGGLDSTYLLYKNLKEGHTVQPYYVEILNNVNKSRIEKQQIMKLHAEFRNEFGGAINNVKHIAKVELWLSWNSNLKFKQTPIWLLATAFMDHNYDEIQIGYVANDDSIPYLNEISKTYKALSWMLDGDKQPKLTFPISKTAKFEMLKALPHNYLKHITSCENPFIEDTLELMDDDTSAKYSEFKDFFSSDKEGRMAYANHEPCGMCDPCRKILNHDYLYEPYVNMQPIYKKLKIKEIMSDYDKVVREVRFNDESKQIFNDLVRIHEYSTMREPSHVNDLKKLEDYKGESKSSEHKIIDA